LSIELPTHVLSTSTFHVTWSFDNGLGSAAAIRRWNPSVSSSHDDCIPAQKLVSVPAELKSTVHRGRWTLTKVCAVITSLHTAYEMVG